MSLARFQSMFLGKDRRLRASRSRRPRRAARQQATGSSWLLTPLATGSSWLLTPKGRGCLGVARRHGSSGSLIAAIHLFTQSRIAQDDGAPWATPVGITPSDPIGS